MSTTLSPQKYLQDRLGEIPTPKDQDPRCTSPLHDALGSFWPYLLESLHGEMTEYVEREVLDQTFDRWVTDILREECPDYLEGYVERVSAPGAD